MALQDLTPQLRTRLSRMERAVGWFVILATALLVFGFVFYIYKTAERKGWFLTKVTYTTSISSGAGLKVGDPVKLMGFDVGWISEIIPNDPYAAYNITVVFEVIKPNYGYIWSDSTVKVAAGDLLGNRYLEVTKGREGVPTVHESQNKVADGILMQSYLLRRKAELKQAPSSQFAGEATLMRELNRLAADAQNKTLFYTNLPAKPYYWLDPEDSPTITERVEKVVNQVEAALPNILNFTNQISAVLSNSALLTANLNEVAVSARPVASNLALVTAQLNQPGALGEWLLPTNINRKLDVTLNTANTNLAVLAQNLNQSLENLANITSNLNAQVQANTNVLATISRAIVDADDLVQGLKRHWLLRSAFKTAQTNMPPKTANDPLRSPKQQDLR